MRRKSDRQNTHSTKRRLSGAPRTSTGCHRLAGGTASAYDFGQKGVSVMRKMALLIVIALLAITAGHSSAPMADWAINATAIEACSCPHFCICYFNPHPAAHHEHGKTEHYCKFNIAYKVNKGHYGSTNLT